MMQNTEQMIRLYHMGFLVFLCLAVVFALLSVLLFFKFDIRGVFDFRTGRGKRRSIKKMEEENSKTGRLSQNMDAAESTSDLYRTPSGAIPPKIYKEEPPVEIRKIDPIVSPRTPQTPDDGSMETSLLSENGGREETTLLNESGAGETTLLDESGAGETTLLDESGAGETTLLDESGAGETTLLDEGGEAETSLLKREEDEAKPEYSQSKVEYGETCLLNEALLTKTEPKHRFTIVKECMFIHTQERV